MAKSQKWIRKINDLRLTLPNIVYYPGTICLYLVTLCATLGLMYTYLPVQYICGSCGMALFACFGPAGLGFSEHHRSLFCDKRKVSFNKIPFCSPHLFRSKAWNLTFTEGPKFATTYRIKATSQLYQNCIFNVQKPTSCRGYDLRVYNTIVHCAVFDS